MSLSEYDRGYIKGCKDMGDELDEYAIAYEVWLKYVDEKGMYPPGFMRVGDFTEWLRVRSGK